MTPAQLVAVDAMREAWGEETVARMLRAGDEVHHAALLTLLEETRGIQRHGYRHLCPDCRRGYGHNSKCRVMRAIDTLEHV